MIRANCLLNIASGMCLAVERLDLKSFSKRTIGMVQGLGRRSVTLDSIASVGSHSEKLLRFLGSPSNDR
jgi:hypothetical protein